MADASDNINLQDRIFSTKVPSMITAPLLGRIERNVGYITLNRPQKRNAINQEMVTELHKHLTNFQENHICTVVIEARPPVFCSGGDIGELGSRLEESSALEFLDLIASKPFFFIAAVGGHAIGAGVAILALCPAVIMAKSARVWLPESPSMNLFPSGIFTYLERSMVCRTAMEMSLSGDALTASECLAAGLVNEVIAESELSAAVTARAERLSKSPHVLGAAIDAWQGRFRTATHRERHEQLMKLVRAENLENFGSRSQQQSERV